MCVSDLELGKGVEFIAGNLTIKGLLKKIVYGTEKTKTSIEVLIVKPNNEVGILSVDPKKQKVTTFSGKLDPRLFEEFKNPGKFTTPPEEEGNMRGLSMAPA